MLSSRCRGKCCEWDSFVPKDLGLASLRLLMPRHRGRLIAEIRARFVRPWYESYLRPKPQSRSLNSSRYKDVRILFDLIRQKHAARPFVNK